MTGFDRRLKDLLEKVRMRAEKEGIQWRKADKDVYAFRAGPYVITFARERDPQIAIYDENGEELEAIDRADLEGRVGADGRPLADIKGRIWRLARRGAGVSAAAMDRVLDWLDERIDDEGQPRGASAPVHAAPPVAEPDQSEFMPQAPQAAVSQSGPHQAGAGHHAQPLPPQPVEPDGEEPQEPLHGPNGGRPGIRPPWAQ